VVERNTVRIVATVGTGTAREFRHRRLGARTTREISISANRSERRGTSSEVVIRDRLELRCTVSVVSRSGLAVCANSAS
jgi:hypothetical protein